MLMFFTNWTTWATFFFFATAVVIQVSKTKNMTILATHHILFQTSLVMNVFVVLVYWPFLYKVDTNRPEIKASVFRTWVARFTHSLPCLSVIINFLLSEITMNKKQGYLLLPIGVAYSVVNYLGCRYYNGVIYWFLDWGKPTAYLVLVLLHVVV